MGAVGALRFGLSYWAPPLHCCLPQESATPPLGPPPPSLPPTAAYPTPGVSNYSIKKLGELLPHCRIKPAVNQVGGLGWGRGSAHLPPLPSCPPFPKPQTTSRGMA